FTGVQSRKFSTQRIITQSLKKGCWQVATILTAKSYIFYLPNTRFGETHIEGYGNPLVNSEKPWLPPGEKINEAINIRVISEDNDIFIHSVEIE
ncbi:hypothetical protein, partial [Siminovitchia fordii]|uniref:hypothetical protein n=1 Tax=Siminovitchia fordii TaxID=254759 RepID=UPI001BB33E2F